MPALGLQAVGTKIYRKGKPWRHIGVNHAMLFMRELYTFDGVANPGLNADLDAIKARGIDLVRVGFGWFDYIRWRDLYWLNKAAYWAKVKEVLDAFAARDMLCIVGVAKGFLSFTQLSYYTTGATIPPGRISEPGNPLYVLWADYVNEFVDRFANHPGVGMWEPGNEISAKLGAEYHRSWAMNGSAGVAYITMGNKPEGGPYGVGEHMSPAEQVRFDHQFVDRCHSRDPHGRIVISGNAVGNAFAVGVRRQNSLAADALADWSGRADTGGTPWVPYRERPYDVICSHNYPLAARVGDSQFFSDGDRTIRQHIQLHKQWADADGKPFVMEEFGSTRYGSEVDPVSVGSAAIEQANFNEALQAIVDYDVPIALVWNWGGNVAGSIEWQLWDITHPTRTYQLDAIQAVNASRS